MARLNLEEPYRTIYPFTQVSVPRQRHLAQLCQIVEESGVPGAVIECGVLDGGTAALMASATSRSGRAVHLFDAWEGLPETTADDGVDAVKWSGQVVGSRRRVIRILKRMDVSLARIRFHQGWFSETFPEAAIDRIALMHVDCDFYEATKLCLKHWTPAMSPGGFVQIDDYDSFQGCRKAVDEFLSERSELGIVLQREDSPGGATFIRFP